MAKAARPTKSCSQTSLPVIGRFSDSESLFQSSAMDHSLFVLRGNSWESLSFVGSGCAWRRAEEVWSKLCSGAKAFAESPSNIISVADLMQFMVVQIRKGLLGDGKDTLFSFAHHLVLSRTSIVLWQTQGTACGFEI